MTLVNRSVAQCLACSFLHLYWKPRYDGSDDLSLNLHILRSFYFWAWVHYYHSQVILSRYNLFYTKSIQYLTRGWLFLSFSVFCRLKCFKFCLSQRIIKALDIKNKSTLVQITKYQALTSQIQINICTGQISKFSESWGTMAWGKINIPPATKLKLVPWVIF